WRRTARAWHGRPRSWKNTSPAGGTSPCCNGTRGKDGESARTRGSACRQAGQAPASLLETALLCRNPPGSPDAGPTKRTGFRQSKTGLERIAAGRSGRLGAAGRLGVRWPGAALDCATEKHPKRCPATALQKAAARAPPQAARKLCDTSAQRL